MPEKWTGTIVGAMHCKKITYDQLATKLCCTKAYVSMVLSGKRKPKDADKRFKKAIDEIIAERKTT